MEVKDTFAPGIIPELYKHLMVLNAQPNNRALERIHCSEVGLCPVTMYFCLIGEKPVSRIRPGTRLIFDVGHAVHGMLEKFYKEALGNQFRSEEFVGFDDPPLIGHVDGIWERPGEKDIGMEFKTIGKKGFNEPPLSGSSAAHPKVEHIWQVHCYMKCTGLDEFRVLYICKDNSKLKEFVVPWQDDVWQAVLDRCHTVMEAAERQEVPYDLLDGTRYPDYYCDECRYLHLCKVGKENVEQQQKRRRAPVPGIAGVYERLRGRHGTRG